MPSNEPAPGPVAGSPPVLRPMPSSPSITLPSSGHGEYEFSYSDNATILDLGSKMSFVGIFMLGIGLFFFGTEIVRWVQTRILEVGTLFLSLLFMVVGIWTHRAGREFLAVARTEGNDVTHLMSALSNLRRFYTLLYLIFFVALIFAVIELGAHTLYGTKQQPVGAIRPRVEAPKKSAATPPPTTEAPPSAPGRDDQR
ncbi:hypothetical protein [Aquisphaera insulae]|uniref:hypothetical protein n=1 Tax=Aquisphaera insulae TaxID=2712864 RepID=UPI0013EBFF10|nr:hypothetical protein [Aquisphaera insulae]